MTRSHLRKFFGSLFLSGIIVASGIFVGKSVNASEHPYYLWISPSSQQLGTLEPGSSHSGEFTVQNSGTKDFNYKVYTAPYTVKDEKYSVSFEKNNGYTLITEWVTFSKTEGFLKSGANEKITYTINIPRNAPAGAQNTAIMVETSDSVEKDSNVQSALRVSSIIYSNVNGTTNNCGKIVEKKLPSLLLNPPISASGIVENCGNTDLNVKYVLKVRPIFSKENIYSNEEQPAVYTTLPETRRYNEIRWDNTPKLGLYNTTLEITYNGKTEVLEKLIIVCPLWIIALVILFIGAVVFWLVSRNRERKEKNGAK